MITDIFLDIDDTLFDFRAAEAIALRDTLRQFAIEPDDAVVARYAVINRAQWEKLERGELTRDEVKTSRFQMLFDEMRTPCDPCAVTAFYESRVAHLPTAPLYQTVPVTVLGLGDIAFVGFGGEPFTDYTRKTEALATDKTVLCVCMANGNEGYLVTDEAFAEGGYEVTNTNFTVGVQAQCLDAADQLLKQF